MLMRLFLVQGLSYTQSNTAENESNNAQHIFAHHCNLYLAFATGTPKLTTNKLLANVVTFYNKSDVFLRNLQKDVCLSQLGDNWHPLF